MDGIVGEELEQQNGGVGKGNRGNRGNSVPCGRKAERGILYMTFQHCMIAHNDYGLESSS